MKVCSSATHEAIKADATAWSALAFVGIQRTSADEAEALELRNCACGSTLCKPIETTTEAA